MSGLYLIFSINGLEVHFQEDNIIVNVYKNKLATIGGSNLSMVITVPESATIIFRKSGPYSSLPSKSFENLQEFIKFLKEQKIINIKINEV